MFGIGAGKIELKLEKTTFSPGETIEGQLLLSLNGPVKAKGVFVKLYAEQSFRQKDKIETRRVYEFPLQLDGEKEYPKTTEPLSYDFQIKVPESAGQVQQRPSLSIGPITIGIGSGAVGPLKWFVEGQLDIPLAFDIRNRVQLNI